LGLGSNVGDRLVNLRAAVDALARNDVKVVGRSSVYETEPQGEVLDQPDFLNAVVAIETSFTPEELLDVCKGIERELGRDFDQMRHGPRVVDIDVLLLGDIEIETERLTLPHREVTSRRFVLVPLLEVAPELPYHDALERLEGQRVQRVGVL
jgi:2-amino-4-hydroxy-6-hydroxymethyldihydropteridine diphosphokinase